MALAPPIGSSLPFSSSGRPLHFPRSYQSSLVLPPLLLGVCASISDLRNPGFQDFSGVRTAQSLTIKPLRSVRFDRVLTSDEEEEMGEGFFQAIEELERMFRDPSDVLGEMMERLSARELQLVLVYFAQEGRDSYWDLEVFDCLRKENRVDGETMEWMVSIAFGWIERLIGEDHAVDDVVALLNEMDCVGLEPEFNMVEKVVSLYWEGGREEGKGGGVCEGCDEKGRGRQMYDWRW